MTPAGRPTRWYPPTRTPAPQAEPHQLPDGRRLVAPQPVQTAALQRGMWIMLDGRPYEITDMRAREGGRVIHLAKHAPHSMTSLETVPVYTVAPALQPAPDDGAFTRP